MLVCPFWLGDGAPTGTLGRPVLAGQLLSSLSYQIANVGNPADAALLARSAVTVVLGRDGSSNSPGSQPSSNASRRNPARGRHWSSGDMIDALRQTAIRHRSIAA